MRRLGLGLLLTLATLGLPGVASAHPLGNFTVNRAVAVEIGDGIAIRYVVDMAEIPALREIQQIDTDGNGGADAPEADRYADYTCTDAADALAVELDGRPAVLHGDAQPSVTFPEGAGGLQTLRLDCRYVVADAPAAGEHELTMRDMTDDPRIGWREVTARAVGSGRIVRADVPSVSDSELLTRYPDAQLASPPNVRSGSLTFTLGSGSIGSPSTEGGAPGGPRQTADDPLAALVGGDLSPTVVALALLVALGLGALHALSPGHGKTLVAAYVLGAGASRRAAMQIGLSVAVSHTAGVFVLGIVTLLASELFLPERVIAWLSLVSGVIVATLGIVLLLRQLAARRHRAAHDHGHDHSHGHSHALPSGGLTWRSALALGFAGGAVPSASAVIVLLVAISSDRLLFGSILIVAFGIGMAAILGGLGLLVARIGSAAGEARGGWLAVPWVRRIGRVAPVAAGVVVLATGVAFAVTAAGQLT